jgi:hypothetical protein
LLRNREVFFGLLDVNQEKKGKREDCGEEYLDLWIIP